MFSCKTSVLPSCSTYDGAKNIWDKAPQPRTDGQRNSWPEDRRPLDDFRKTHYAIKKDGDAYAFLLYDTPLVTWVDPDTVKVILHDSVSSRKFTWRYLPDGWQVVSTWYYPSNCLTGHGAFYIQNYDTPLTIKKDGWRWVIDGEFNKPTKQVVDKKRAAEIVRVYKSAFDFVKHIWAVCGDNGHHPWVGSHQSILDNPTEHEKLIRSCLRKTHDGRYAPTSRQEVTAKMRSILYQRHDCYVRVPYDK